MSVAVCTLGCARKREDIHSWATLDKLEGDYTVYVNYEDVPGLVTNHGVNSSFPHKLADMIGDFEHDVYVDAWSWGTYGRQWRRVPAFDQDQARLASIVAARNMCIEYAMQTDSSHLLFVDADIIPPLDIIPKLLETGKDAVGGLVYGRGAHQHVPYIFGEKGRQRVVENALDSYELIEAEHANIGFAMISRRLFEAVRFRYGTSHYPDGRICMTSDDPAFHLDCFIKFGSWMYIRTDVVGKHIGDLAENETSQF